jgi:hypothetical protein
MGSFVTIKPVASLTAQEKMDLAVRLWRRGFHSFDRAREAPGLNPDEAEATLVPELRKRLANVPDAELVFAIQEFQVYTLLAPKLAVRQAGKLGPSDGAIREALAKLIKNAPKPDGHWSDGWDACLDVWEEKGTSEDKKVNYQCPVVIDQLDAWDGDLSELDDLDGRVLGPDDVWEVGNPPPNSRWQFVARDYSGMFAILAGDVAFAEAPEMQQPDWLHKRRVFGYRRAAYKKGAEPQDPPVPSWPDDGLTVWPWRALELRPQLLKEDASLIKGEGTWSSAFKIIRALSVNECYAFLDLLQNYDDAFLSLPLFHFSVPSVEATAKSMPKSPLGGLVGYLEHVLQGKDREFLGRCGLRVDKNWNWQDHLGAGAAYDTGSGEDHSTPSGIEGTLEQIGGKVGKTAGLPLHDSLDLLRRPHVAYRVAMFLRTNEAVRVAIWRFALHRLRQVAWLRLPEDDEIPADWQGRRLGEIVTSELALAMILRLAVKSPGWILTATKQAAGGRVDLRVSMYGGASSGKRHHLGRWLLAAREAAGASGGAFEDHLIQVMTGGQPCRGVYIPKELKFGQLTEQLTGMTKWAQKAPDLGFAYRIQAAELHGGLMALRSSPGSSPFIDAQGVFRDPFPSSGIAQSGHATAANAPPYHGSTKERGAEHFRDKARKAGIAPDLPGAHWPPGVRRREAVEERTAREAQAASAQGRLWTMAGKIDTVPAHSLRTHPLFNQRWARLQLDAFTRTAARTPLLCGTEALAPEPGSECWGLSTAQQGMTVHAFDWRTGDALQPPPAVKVGTCTGDAQELHVQSSAGNADVPADVPSHFGIVDTPLAKQTHKLFAQACRAAGAELVDSFDVTLAKDAIRLRLGWMRARLDWSTSKVAPASELGFFLRYLQWVGGKDAPSELYLAGLGIAPAHAPGEAFFRAADKADRWRPEFTTRLWRPRAADAVTTSADLALAHVTWPALYRFRKLVQESAVVRRALYDAWRVRLRDMLDGEVTHWGLGKPRLFQMFGSETSLLALAHWQAKDPQGLATEVKSGKGLAAITTWLKANPAKKDVSQWTKGDESEVFWDLLVGNMAGSDLKAELLKLKPQTPSARPAADVVLGTLIDLDALKGTQRPATPVVTPGKGRRVAISGAGPVRVGLLVAEDAVAAPMAASVLNATTTKQYLVSGLLLIAEDEAKNRQGVELGLPAPVRLTITQPAAPTSTSVQLYSSPTDSQTVDVEDAEFEGAFDLEVDLGAWFGTLDDGIHLYLSLSGSVGGGKLQLALGGRIGWPLGGAEVRLPPTSLVDLDLPNNLKLVGGVLSWTWPEVFKKSLGEALPFGTIINGDVVLSASLPATGPSLSLQANINAVTVPLGSPVASLVLKGTGGGKLLALDVGLLAGEASLQLPDAVQVELDLQLSSDGRVLGAKLPEQVAPAGGLLPNAGAAAVPVRAPISLDLGEIQPGAKTELKWSGGSARIPASLFPSMSPKLDPARSFDLNEIAGDWLGEGSGGRGLKVSVPNPPALVSDDDAVKVELGLQFTLSLGGEDIDAEGQTTVVASCKVQDKHLVIDASSFGMSLQDTRLSFPTSGKPIELGSVAKLTLPDPLVAKLNFTGDDDPLNFDLAPAPIALQIPADGGFVFDVEELSLGKAGATLKARIRSGDTTVKGLGSLSDTMNVRSKKGEIGMLRVVRGRLTEASLEAETRLQFFDDATGVLRLRLFQEQAGGELSALAQFDAGVNRQFHIRALYTVVDVESIHLSLKYGGGKWSASGGMTGAIAFEPEGPMSGRLAEYSNLFDGTRLQFENLDLGNLGSAAVRVEIAPRTLEIATLFRVTLRGFVLHQLTNISLRNLSILGDIEFVGKLPSLDIGLTLGDIHLRQVNPDDLIPKIKIRQLGMSIALPSGFSFKGVVEEFDDEKEYGFAGSAYLKSSAFPRMEALVKMTKLVDRNDLPSIVVYVAMDREDHLAYGFFLRKVGLGVGVNQGIVGFSDKPSTPLFQRVDTALKKGIRYPGNIDSWAPVELTPKDDAVLSLVAFGQVSFGLLDRDTDHALVSTLVLSLDENLDIIAGINGWFFSSPNDTQRLEFTSSPAVRGAIGLSPREQVLYGRFKTMKGSKTGKTAKDNPLGQMLMQSLEAMELTASFYADSRGALLEIAYPRQARYQIVLGPMRGEAEAGFRFGFYRGTQVVGLNLAVHAEIGGGFSGDLGFANVELSARAAFELQASFAGAFASDGRVYVLADVMLSALIEISARIYKRIEVRNRFFSFTWTVFDISTSIQITATASLAVAIIPDGIGFAGSVDVRLHIGGFGFGARLSIAFDAGRIDTARRRIHELVPPIAELTRGSTAPQPLALPAGVAALANAVVVAEELAAGQLQADIEAQALPEVVPVPKRWRLYVRRVGESTRVVLYPDAVPVGELGGYPTYEGAKRSHVIVLRDGLTVSVPRHDKLEKVSGTVEIDEDASKVLVAETEMRKQDPSFIGDLVVGDLLGAFVRKAEPAVQPEIVDVRTRNPVAGDFDDPAVLADPDRRSTHFRLRYSDGSEASTYDDHVRKAREAAPGSNNDDLTHRNAELLSLLLKLAERADPGLRDPEKIESFDPLDYAAATGLVLVFEDQCGDWYREILQKGHKALTDKPIRMFGEEVEFVDPSDAHFAFETDWSNTFQGRGELALSWQLSRDGVGAGPGSHHGVREYRIRREVLSGPLTDRDFVVAPAWVTYVDLASRRFYIRPRFQFVDSTLPFDANALLRYKVEAIPDEDLGATEPLATTVFDMVWYQPVKTPASIARAQSLLRLAQDTSAAALEFRVEVEWPADTADAELDAAAALLEVHSRAVPAGRVGKYGAGDESDVSLAWKSDLQEVELRLPQVDQSRRMDWSLVPGERRAERLRFARVPPRHMAQAAKQSESPTILVSYAATIALGGDESLWADLGLGVGGAAEYTVGIRSSRERAGTPRLRCRPALSVNAAPGADALEDAWFAEGRQVAAIERIALGKAPKSDWLGGGDVEAWPEIEVASQGSTLDVAIRGRIRHDVSRTHPRGVPVAYRVWMRDRLDELEAEAIHIPPRPVAFLHVQPERVFRAIPQSVVVVQLPANPTTAKKRPDWAFEAADASNTPTFRLRQEVVADHAFAEVSTVAGAKVALSSRLAALVGDATLVPRLVLDVLEPLYPAPADGEDPPRASSLLKRYIKDADMHGWRLLEALGASATVWRESDDDRLPFVRPDGARVACVHFQRLPKELRPVPEQASALYAARVFDPDMLLCLGGLDLPKAQALVTGAEADLTAVERSIRKAVHALGAPVDAAKTELLVDFLLEVRRRVVRFVEVLAQPKPGHQGESEVLELTAVYRADCTLVAPPDVETKKPPASAEVPSSEGTLTLPAIGGWVEFRLPFPEGFARDLKFAVEVIHRHDVLPDKGLTPPAVGEEAVRVELPRTAALHPEIFGMGIASGEGTVEIHVGVHAAQRAALYRDALARRVQFIDQSVGLSPAVDEGGRELLERLLGQFEDPPDWEAWLDTWQPGAYPVAAGPMDFAEQNKDAGSVTRGMDSYRVPALPVGYLWSPRVLTRAGVRRSDDGVPASSGQGLAPMFGPLAAGAMVLAYRDHPVTSVVDAQGRLHIELPLARRIDALPPTLRRYWATRDRTWTVGNVEAPVLHWPDQNAKYVIGIRTTGKPDASAELLELAVDGSARWLLEQEAPTVEAATVLFDASAAVAEWAGALGLRIGVELRAMQGANSLAWLADALLAETPAWRVEVFIERDGLRYPCKELA